MTELEVFQQSLRVSQIALVISVLISMVSIVFGILSMAFQRSHNRKSVKPFCNVDSRRTGGGLGIFIANAGLGPMRVTGIRITRNRMDGGMATDDPIEAAAPASGILLRAEACADRVLPPLAEILVIECALAGTAAKRVARSAMQRLRECSLVVSFSDVYDHTYEKVEPLARLLEGGSED
jgi:hypothetical protein